MGHQELMDINFWSKKYWHNALIVTFFFTLRTPCSSYMFRTITTINSDYFPTQHSKVALYNEHGVSSLYGRNSRILYNLEECFQRVETFNAHYLYSRNLETMVLGFLSLLKEGAGNGSLGSQTSERYKKNVVHCTGSSVGETKDTTSERFSSDRLHWRISTVQVVLK